MLEIDELDEIINSLGNILSVLNKEKIHLIIESNKIENREKKMSLQQSIIEKIIDIVCAYFNIGKDIIYMYGDGRSRGGSNANAHYRGIAAYFINKYVNTTVTSIGKIFGKHHSSILYMIREVEVGTLSVQYAKEIKELNGIIEKELNKDDSIQD